MPEFPRKKIDVSHDRLRVAVHKWSKEILNEGYVPFPKRLVRCLTKIFTGDQPLIELAVILAIVDYRRPDLRNPPSFQFLAFSAGIDVEQFRQCVSNLKERGLLNWEGAEDFARFKIDGLLRHIEELTRDDDPHSTWESA